MRVAVAGAGIAGLTSALVFAGTGHEVEIYERRTGFGEAGAGIQLSPNATRILLGLGLGTALSRAGVEPERIVIRSLPAGRTIGEVALSPFMKERFGAPYLSIARPDLHTALLDAVRGRGNIRIRVGRAIVGLTQSESGVAVETEGSGGARETASADLLVGADGLWSTVRRLIGDDRAPAYSGHAAYRAVLGADALGTGLGAAEAGLWLGRGRHVVHYPVEAGRRLNMVVVAGRPDPIEGWSNIVDRDRVLAAIGDAPAALTAMAAAAGQWSGWSLFELPAARLAADRVALVGDAAHPVLPYLAQGGGLAIEDAAHLGARVGREAGAVRDALRRYRRERLARIRRVQGAARRNGSVYHAGLPVSLARDIVMRRLGPTGMAERYAWIYGWRAPVQEPTA